MTIQSKTYDKSSERTHSDVVAGYDVPFSALDLSLSFDTMETKSTTKNLEGEIWKPILGWEGIYEISNKGRVKSLERIIEFQKGSLENIKAKRIQKEKIIKGLLRNGYYHVQLHNNCKIKTWKIHRLVAIAFIPNPNNYPIINHKDENKLNNCVDNLEWCDYKYNLNYGTSRKRLSKSITKSRGIKVIQKDKNGNLIARYNSFQEAANAVGVNRTNIYRVARNIHYKGWGGKSYKKPTAGGYIWELE